MSLFEKQVEILVTLYGEEIRQIISQSQKGWIYDFINSFNPRRAIIKELCELIVSFKRKSHIYFEDIFLKLDNFADLYLLYSKYFEANYFKEQVYLLDIDLKFDDTFKLLDKNEIFIFYICSGLFNININEILEFPWLLEINDNSLNSLLLKLQDPENIEIRQNLSPEILSKGYMNNLYGFLKSNNLKVDSGNLTIPQCTNYSDFEIDLEELKKFNNVDYNFCSQYVIYSFYLEELNNHINIISPNIQDPIYIGHTRGDLTSLKGFIPEKYINLSKQVYTQNIGRDWGGFYQILSNIPNHKEITVLSHVKKSPFHSKIYTKKWVQEISIPISINKNALISKYMHENPSIGIIASKLHRDYGIGKNYLNYHKLCDILEIPLDYREINYLAGSFFIIRTSILLDFFSKLNLQLFKNDSDDSFDATLAHSAERAIFSYARSKKFKLAWI